MAARGHERGQHDDRPSHKIEILQYFDRRRTPAPPATSSIAIYCNIRVSTETEIPFCISGFDRFPRENGKKNGKKTEIRFGFLDLDHKTEMLEQHFRFAYFSFVGVLQPRCTPLLR